MPELPARAVCLMALLLLAGCTGVVLEGLVTDVTGEPLPGVMVMERSSGRQAVSDALGLYRLRLESGPAVLNFAKTGYTPGQLDLEIPADATHARARPVSLWQLPPDRGVYLFEGDRYTATESVEAVHYELSDGDAIVGTPRWAAAITTDPEPVIIAYDLPYYGAGLYRMRQGEFSTTDPNGRTIDRELWTIREEMPARAEPIDELHGMLLRIQPYEPLPAGTYAVGWSGIDDPSGGELTRIYLFAVAPSVRAIEPLPGEDGKDDNNAEEEGES